ncbi:SH3 domain-containing protein [Szabonella alba]|uniref:SH3 domain-containing protein n=1 Tax=Szabonella alba TaxID=2804194 RepID=A0A8K0VAD1_9RHOB|nr:SH3 domain-containing protein [Szabonella alba]MBL4918412.1 SH3 domain-containing protein [Szabonella alba]
MIRLLLLLSATMFVTMLIGGQDRGQMRQGLIAAAESELPLPADPVQQAPAAQTPATQTMVETPIAPPADPQTAPVTLASLTPLSPALPAQDGSAVAQPALYLSAETPAPVADQITLAEPVSTPEPVTEAEPEFLPLLYVNSAAINVRQGPSTDHAVIGRLTRNESVLVVEPEFAGWVRIRIEGDGVEGFVAARLMTEQDPAGN